MLWDTNTLGQIRTTLKYTITDPAGILQLGQSSSHSRGLFSALQQILQNTETKLARPRCHHGKIWYHNIETNEL